MKKLKIKIESFGFKHSPEIKANFSFDLRCLPNPFYVEELKEKTGKEKEVRDFIMQKSASNEFLEKIISLLEFAVDLYIKEGKEEITVALGCTGGQHRSVAFAEILAEHFEKKGFTCLIFHRDMNKR